MQETNATNEAMLDSLIKKSTIPNAGLGLFAGKKRIKRGTSLGLYMGWRLRNKKLAKYYPESGLPLMQHVKVEEMMPDV